MAIGRTNAVGKAGTQFSLVVTVETGSLVTATKGTRSVSGTAVNGSCVLTLPEAGTWTVTATRNGQTSDTKTVSVVDSYAVSLTFFSATITVTAPSGAVVTLKKGGSTVDSKTSTGTAVFTVYETGEYTVEATQGGQSTSGTVNVTASTASYAITLSFVSDTLNENSWDTISEVSDAGEGANYWAIGDRKQVTLNGTVGSLSLSNFSTYAFIIGFNHNSGREGSGRIHFQLAKTALSGGTDICFTDGSYNSSGSSAAFRMNTSNTNSGGWKDSYMRNNICGTSKTSTSGRIMGAIPADLRNALKSVTKYTDNTGNASTSSSAVTATTDYIFLLSEYEVFGSCSIANSNEASRQQQYDYYSAGNSKVKYRHTSTSSAAISSASTAIIKPGRTKPSAFLTLYARPSENPFLRNSTPAPIPAAKPKSPATAVTSPPPRRITMRSGQPRKASAPTITIIPSTKRSAGAEPARARNSRPASAVSMAPSTSPTISGRRYCTFSALCRPSPPAMSRRKHAIQKPMLAGLPAAVRMSAARPTITPVPATRYLLLLITFSLVFCFADTAVLHLHSGVIH